MKRISLPLRLYPVIALLAAALLSASALSFIPILLLAWYLSLWRWRFKATTRLMTVYFLFLAVSLLFISRLGPYLAILPSLPLLLLLNCEQTVHALDIHPRQLFPGWRITPVFAALVLAATGSGLIALVLSSVTLGIVSSIAVLYLASLYLHIRSRTPARPVTAGTTRQRLLAGKEGRFPVRLKLEGPSGGRLYLEPDAAWIKINPRILPLVSGNPQFELTVIPDLSGPSTVKLNACTIDRCGVLQTWFELEPVALTVIPRATYAARLAEKYLSGTRPGSLPLWSNVSAAKPQQGLRRGVEYYGNRLYQLGDSLKNIDWKHSYQYNELISKEFAEFHGEPAVVLVNLVAENAEAADKLAFTIVTAAVSLAQESVPSALAAYTHETVVITTPFLGSRDIVQRSLQLIKSITIHEQTLKYLNSPDIIRLKNTIQRVRRVESKPAQALAGILSMEYLNLSRSAGQSPCTRALVEIEYKIGRQYSLLVISGYNHDAGALALAALNHRSGNRSVINFL